MYSWYQYQELIRPTQQQQRHLPRAETKYADGAQLAKISQVQCLFQFELSTRGGGCCVRPTLLLSNSKPTAVVGMGMYMI